ncbi:uncharacterized protein LOC120326254 [Styela clava]
MTSLWVISSHLVPICLFIFLTTAVIGKRPTRDEVPPTEIDGNGCECVWTPWMNNDDYDANVGDNTTYDKLRGSYDFCEKPRDIKCRDSLRWEVPYHLLRLKHTICDVEIGLRCVSIPRYKARGRRTHFCSDYEITVQCCHCTTTTKEPKTTVAITTASMEKPEKIILGIHDTGHGIFEGDTNWADSESNKTMPESKSSSNENDEVVPLAVILVIVFGCIAVIAFSLIIWMIMTKGFFMTNRKRFSHDEYYQEAPMEIIRTPIKLPDTHPEKHKVAFARTNSSSYSDYMTSSSDDEGYRSRPSKNRKRKKTKRQRDRNLNNANNRSDYTSDSFEFPTLDSRSPPEENSDEGRLRKWFPDEYERSQQQKRQQQRSTKSKLMFNTSNKKSIPYMDNDS